MLVRSAEQVSAEADRLPVHAYTGHGARAAASATGSAAVRKVHRRPGQPAYFLIARIRQSGPALSLVVLIATDYRNPKRLIGSLELLDRPACGRGEAQAHQQLGIACDLPVRTRDRAGVVAGEELHEAVGHEVLGLARLLQVVHDRLLVVAHFERVVLLSGDRVPKRDSERSKWSWRSRSH
jgi:hypothetical protein